MQSKVGCPKLGVVKRIKYLVLDLGSMVRSNMVALRIEKTQPEAISFKTG